MQEICTTSTRQSDGQCRWKKAVGAYNKATETNWDDAKAYLGLGRSYHELNRYKDAISVFKQAAEIEPDDVKAHYGLGLTYISKGDTESALGKHKILKTLNEDLAK